MNDEDVIEKIIKYYNDCCSVKATANYFGFSESKIRKILVNNGTYQSNKYDIIRNFVKASKSVSEIASILGISAKAVQSYLPYSKSIYGINQSKNAIRICKCRGKEKKI
jgi:phage-related minor tail protein